MLIFFRTSPLIYHTQLIARACIHLAIKYCGFKHPFEKQEAFKKCKTIAEVLDDKKNQPPKDDESSKENESLKHLWQEFKIVYPGLETSVASALGMDFIVYTPSSFLMQFIFFIKSFFIFLLDF
jgi:hypothetical protein